MGTHLQRPCIYFSMGSTTKCPVGRGIGCGETIWNSPTGQTVEKRNILNTNAQP
jgi:hypothetical protein